MKFTKAYEKEFTANEMMKDLTEEILSGDYSDLNDLIKANADYIAEFTADEIARLEETFRDYEEILEEIADEIEAENEKMAMEYEAEIRYMNAEYYRSVAC